MIYDNFFIERFEPLQMTVDRIGPFQEKIQTFDFMDTDKEPCNFYFFISENGRGKTTLLELMATLMRMLSYREMENFGYEGLDKGTGRVQWDIRIRLSMADKTQTIVLSLIAGSIGKDTLLQVWGADNLETVGAASWHRFGFRKRTSGRLELIGKSDELVRDITNAIQSFMGDRPQGFSDDPMTFPTLLYFSAYRDILPIRGNRSISAPEDWGYRPVHIFGQEGDRWLRSLDNLLVWLKWLDEKRFKQARDFINEYVFKGTLKYLKKIRKYPPEAIVENEGEEHRLDQLSSGEKSLVQMFLRIGVHSTRNTILLIDEMDVHLHTKWQHRLLNQLKQMAKEKPGLTVIVSTHSREILKLYKYDIEEKGLRKGGHIIEDDD